MIILAGVIRVADRRPLTMIRHIVIFKFKPDVAEDERDSALSRLRALPDQIPVIRELEVGEDVVRSPRSWDYALVSVFDNLATLNEYQVNEAHMAAANRMREMCESIASVDFEF